MSDSMFPDKITVNPWSGQRWCRVIREYGDGFLKVKMIHGEVVATHERHITRNFYLNDAGIKAMAEKMLPVVEAHAATGGICVGPLSRATGIEPASIRYVAEVRPDLFTKQYVKIDAGDQKFGYEKPMNRGTNVVLIQKKV